MEAITMSEIMVIRVVILLILTLLASVSSAHEAQYCREKNDYTSDGDTCSGHPAFTNKRYILYDVNPLEGFNLRRDVYMRAAIFVSSLSRRKNAYDWRLVLPPWGDLYHWKSSDIGPQQQIPWSAFFDVQSLQKYAPVIEAHEFFKDYSKGSNTALIDRLYILQNDEEMFRTGDFSDKNQFVECGPDSLRRYGVSDNSRYYSRPFWGYSNVTANEVKCLIFHGTMNGLEENLYPQIYGSVMFDHMEIPLHDSYGNKDYWDARRSMRYSSTLYAVAAKYRQKHLNSNDADDNTEQPSDWTLEKSKRDALGGPYLCVHMRRRDFVTGRGNSVPTIKAAALQLTEKMDQLNLLTIFVATDAVEHEYNELKSYLGKYIVKKYTPTNSDRKLYKDGGVAIIDQIICSKARYFIGTHESTFTFRIQEDREIMGFPSNTTFNRLCGKEKCSSGGSWKIVWR